ncbi:MAG: hypothetical protein DRO05_02060 [Thermoproteota archaeon]|nr:MAG: hypothetical protein DRO05_02060 [Candidatus Korarchaeota archaeon]
MFRTSEGYIAVLPLRLSMPLTEMPKNLVEGGRVVFTRLSAVISSRHAAIATYRALRAFKEGKNLARNLELEVAVCLTGERQIHRALAQTDPIGADRLVSIIISPHPLDWEGVARRICEVLGAVQTSDFCSAEDLARKFGVHDFSSCSGRLEFLILEKAALVELER